MGFLIIFFLTFLLWLLYSGLFDTLHLGLGIISCLIVTAMLFPVLRFTNDSIPQILRILWRFFLYIPRLSWEIILSNIDIAYRTLHPALPINPKVIKLKTNLKTDLGKVIMGNAITLQPGTITISIDGDEFTVHAVADEPADLLISGAMDKRIKQIEKI